jgi:hypothetical protein
MTSSTLISPSGQGLSSTQKTVDYLFARDPGARGRLEGTSSPAPPLHPPDGFRFGNVSVIDDHAVSRRAPMVISGEGAGRRRGLAQPNASFPPGGVGG